MKLLSFFGLLSILATNPNIEYTGRIDFSKANAPQFSYSGVSIRASIDASSASVILNDEKGENLYAVIVDKVYTGKLKTTKGKSTYSLAEFQEKGMHEIEIVKITEEQFGKTAFLGFELGNDGEIVEIQNKRELLIEFIGNSITCGYGNEDRIGHKFCAETENHYMSYAAITARSFNARALVACKSGIGIYRNYAGPTEGNEDCMTNYYSRTHLYEEKPKYNFNEQPDLVCINLGTNDFSTPGYDTTRFIDNYMNLIGQIQTNYDRPEILCLTGCMLDGDALEIAKRCINQVVRQANALNKGNVYFFEMTPQDIKKNGLGVDFHPTVKQHIQSARQLIGYISKLKEWDVDPQIVKAEVSGTNQITLYANDEECLFTESLTDMIAIADGSELHATDWLIDENGAAMIIKFKEDISNVKNIELQGDNNVNKLLRCKVSMNCPETPETQNN